MPRIHRVRGFATILEVNEFVEMLEMNGYGEAIDIKVKEGTGSYILFYYVNTSMEFNLESLNDKIKRKEAEKNGNR